MWVWRPPADAAAKCYLRYSQIITFHTCSKVPLLRCSQTAQNILSTLVVKCYIFQMCGRVCRFGDHLQQSGKVEILFTLPLSRCSQRAQDGAAEYAGLATTCRGILMLLQGGEADDCTAAKFCSDAWFYCSIVVLGYSS